MSKRKNNGYRGKRITITIPFNHYDALKQIKGKLGFNTMTQTIRYLLIFPRHNKGIPVKSFNVFMRLLGHTNNHLHNIDMILSTDYYNNYNLLSKAKHNKQLNKTIKTNDKHLIELQKTVKELNHKIDKIDERKKK